MLDAAAAAAAAAAACFNLCCEKGLGDRKPAGQWCMPLPTMRACMPHQHACSQDNRLRVWDSALEAASGAEASREIVHSHDFNRW